jgi:hypothetical protein
LFNPIIGKSIPDNQSGYRMLSRRFIDALLTSNEQGFEFEVEMLATCMKGHFDMEWVPIRTIYAGESSHINPVTHIINYVRVLWIMRQKMRAQAI